MTLNLQKKTSSPIGLPTDAGLSFVELIIVLGILAGVTAMVASSMRVPLETGPTTFEKVASFVETARLEAMQSGQAGLLVVLPAALNAGDRQLRWSADAGFVSVGEGGEGIVGAYRAIVYPDGSVSGAPLSFVARGLSRRIVAVMRSIPSTGSGQ